jgi:hypothetical protein
MACVSELIPGKWYASKAFKVRRGPGIDPKTINEGVHYTVLSPPFDSKHEVEQWGKDVYDGPDQLYIWQFHGWSDQDRT